MKQIGTIKFLQIQRDHLKSGEPRTYHPDPILQVARLVIDRQGIHGIDEDGQKRIDVHHEAHPHSRFRGDNRISLGFIAHYAAIRARFGAHMLDGLAGENIIIESSEAPHIPPQSQVIIRPEHGDDIPLCEVIPAPPCREFSNFCAGRLLDGAELKRALQFLDGGRRGYYAALDSEKGYELSAGAAVWLS